MLINSQVIQYLTSYSIALCKHLLLYVYIKSCDDETFRYESVKHYSLYDAKIIEKCQ